MRLQLAGLEHEVARSGRWVAWAGAVVALLLLLLAAWLYDLRMREIRSFATLDQLDLRAIPRAPLAAELVYRPTSAGKVEFIRVASQSKETLVEHHSIEDTTNRDPRRFSWTGSDRDYKVLVRYRENGRIREQSFDPPQLNGPRTLERGQTY